MSTKGNILDQVKLLAHDIREVGQKLDQAVIEARAIDATWDEIGAALGLTALHARELYFPLVDGK
jgi:hypothetical protein